MFFYGTLKRGQRNHERYCGGALRIEEAAVRGELYDLPRFGYPALVVPEESVRAFGTGSPVRDAEEQHRLERGGVALSDGPHVFGEVSFFGDPGLRLPVMDLLEGFDPADASSHYRRVLIPVHMDDGPVLLAWAYAVRKSSGVYLPDGVWPPL